MNIPINIRTSENGNLQTSQYKQGTYVVQSYPWGLYLKGAALCSDGKVRKLARVASTADTWFSIPASVRVNGKTVAGWIGIEDGVVKFHAYNNRKNSFLLPAWSKDED